MNFDTAIGTELFLVQPDRAHSTRIYKVGAKYFYYLDHRGDENQRIRFDKETGRFSSNRPYASRYRLYPSEQAYCDQQETIRLWRSIQEKARDMRDDTYDLETLRAIDKLLKTGEN